MEVDLADYPLDHPLTEIKTDGAQSLLDWVRQSVEGREATVGDIGVLASRSSRVTGTPQQIVEQLKEWQAAGIDGINVINATIPGSYTDFIDQVMPLLRDQGLAKQEYVPGTLRRKIFGYDTLPDTHPAAKYRNAFGSRSDKASRHSKASSH